MNNTVRVGSRIRDNDKRFNGRTFEVLEIKDGAAFYRAATRLAKVRLDRIYTDDRQHSNGWSLVRLNPQGGI